VVRGRGADALADQTSMYMLVGMLGADRGCLISPAHQSWKDQTLYGDLHLSWKEEPICKSKTRESNYAGLS
jgi:hypothetical protein